MSESRRAAGADRAAQFVPFAALDGYFNLVREQERPRECRREPSEDEAALISSELAALRVGQSVRVTYYNSADKTYVTHEGTVTEVDGTFRRLRLAKEVISFDDVWSITALPEP